jgi:hypothetical protein
LSSRNGDVQAANVRKEAHTALAAAAVGARRFVGPHAGEYDDIRFLPLMRQ